MPNRTRQDWPRKAPHRAGATTERDTMKTDRLTPERVKAYADLTPADQRRALRLAYAVAGRYAVDAPNRDDIATMAAVYAAPTLTPAGSDEEWLGRLGVAARWIAADLRPTNETVADLAEPRWADRLVAPDTYAPHRIAETTVADMAHAVLAGCDDMTRDYLPLAARTPLDDDTDRPTRIPTTRAARGNGASGYQWHAATQGRLGKRLAVATGSPERTARRHVNKALMDARTVARHGVAWLATGQRQRQAPAVTTEASPYVPSAEYGTHQLGRALAFRLDETAVASPVVTMTPTPDGYTLTASTADGRVIATHEAPDLPTARTYGEAWLASVTEGPPTRNDAQTADDRQADGLAERMTPKGPVKRLNTRKRPRSGSTGPTVPAHLAAGRDTRATVVEIGWTYLGNDTPEETQP